MEIVGSLSPAVAADAVDMLLEEFEKALIAIATAVKVQPYGILYT
jgi:hypothetical protein